MGISHRPTVYSQIRSSLIKERKDAGSEAAQSSAEALARVRYDIASEMADHTFAGFDTGSIVLLYLAWELSKMENAVWQERLRHEAKSRVRDCSARELDSLPVLRAVIMETLRLHAPVPGNSVRSSPGDRTTFLDTPKGHRILLPPNIRIHAQAWSLHRNPSAFPDPERWNPMRWLESNAEQLKEMQRWFWAFGSGSRMCAGSSFAIIELKRLALSIWKEMRSEIVNADGMVHNGGFISGPLGYEDTYLKLRFTTA